MIKIIKRIIAGFWLLNGLFAQESIFWEIVDAGVNSEFIESYINRLIEVDKFEENSIQASFSIILNLLRRITLIGEPGLFPGRSIIYPIDHRRRKVTSCHGSVTRPPSAT